MMIAIESSLYYNTANIRMLQHDKESINRLEESSPRPWWCRVGSNLRLNGRGNGRDDAGRFRTGMKGFIEETGLRVC